jgi:stalled ribosome rescue protein Dom34
LILLLVAFACFVAISSYCTLWYLCLQAAAEVAALARFYKMLAHDEDRAVYGPGHVQAAFDAAAIDTLLLSDGLFR